jgi:hypothetical protein
MGRSRNLMTPLTEARSTYLDHPHVARAVRIGGVGRLELLAEIQRNRIALNQAGLELFADDRFTTDEATSILETVEITVASLGFARGATIANICERAVQLALCPCPLELGPHLRLQYLDQPEGQIGRPPSRHRAPPGSLTIASAPIAEDDDFPKGFYLRRIDGVLWLRGYRSGPDHVWSQEDHFVFAALPGRLHAPLAERR